jgi:hypothetical protein
LVAVVVVEQAALGLTEQVPRRVMVALVFQILFQVLLLHGLAVVAVEHITLEPLVLAVQAVAVRVEHQEAELEMRVLLTQAVAAALLLARM